LFKQRLRSEIINYISNRLDEFSSEIKQTADLPSSDDFIKQPIVSTMDLETINKIGNELLTTGLPDIDTKKKSSPFPTKTFRMRLSILTELLEVSHIRSIRQIFISILVIVFLQVAITDLFELGTYVKY
jgi:hypothetical protein